MRLIKTHNIIILFFMGLLFSPSFSYEKKVDDTIKFESGLNIFANEKGKTAQRLANNTKKLREIGDIFVSEFRVVFQRSLDFVAHKASLSKNYYPNKYSILSYIQKINNQNYYYKDLYQLQILLN